MKKIFAKSKKFVYYGPSCLFIYIIYNIDMIIDFNLNVMS